MTVGVYKHQHIDVYVDDYVFRASPVLHQEGVVGGYAYFDKLPARWVPKDSVLIYHHAGVGYAGEVSGLCIWDGHHLVQYDMPELLISEIHKERQKIVDLYSAWQRLNGKVYDLNVTMRDMAQEKVFDYGLFIENDDVDDLNLELTVEHTIDDKEDRGYELFD